MSSNHFASHSSGCKCFAKVTVTCLLIMLQSNSRSAHLVMLKEKAITLLKIHPEEMRMVAWMGVLFLLVQAGQGFGDTVAYGLFVSKNADRLPYMYVPLGIIVFLVSLAYTASLGR